MCRRPGVSPPRERASVVLFTRLAEELGSDHAAPGAHEEVVTDRDEPRKHPKGDLKSRPQMPHCPVLDPGGGRQTPYPTSNLC